MAAKVALSARHQDKFERVHETLMRIRRPYPDSWVWNVAAMADLDMDVLRQSLDDPAIDRALADNLKLGLRYRMRGTPSYLVGETFLMGGTIRDIKALVAEERSGR